MGSIPLWSYHTWVCPCFIEHNHNVINLDASSYRSRIYHVMGFHPQQSFQAETTQEHPSHAYPHSSHFMRCPLGELELDICFCRCFVLNITRLKLNTAYQSIQICKGLPGLPAHKFSQPLDYHLCCSWTRLRPESTGGVKLWVERLLTSQTLFQSLT